MVGGNDKPPAFPQPTGQTTATAPPGEPATPSPAGQEAYVANIHARLAVANDTLKGSPGDRVDIEANDRIRFVLTLTNPTKWRTQAISVAFACTAFCSPNQSGGLKMKAIVSDVNGRRLTAPKSVVIDGIEQGSAQNFIKASIPAQRIGSQGQTTVAEPFVGQPRITAAEGRSVATFQFGQLDPHEQGRLEFGATWGIARDVQLAGGGSLYFRAPSGTWKASRVSLRAGQRARVSMLLDASRYPSVPLVSIDLTPKADNGYVQLEGHAVLPRSVGIGGTTDFELSTGRVYSQGGGPLRLSVDPELLCCAAGIGTLSAVRQAS